MMNVNEARVALLDRNCLFTFFFHKQNRRELTIIKWKLSVEKHTSEERDWCSIAKRVTDIILVYRARAHQPMSYVCIRALSRCERMNKNMHSKYIIAEWDATIFAECRRNAQRLNEEYGRHTYRNRLEIYKTINRYHCWLVSRLHVADDS